MDSNYPTAADWAAANADQAKAAASENARRIKDLEIWVAALQARILKLERGTRLT